MLFGRILTELFSILLLALLSVEVCLSNGSQNRGDYNPCNAAGGGNRQYFLIPSNQGHSWTQAQQICESRNSHLPIIRNEEEQRALENYLKCLQNNRRDIYSVWTSGKKEIYPNWTWINGQTLDYNAANSTEENKIKTHIVWTNVNGGSFKQENPQSPAWYLCQKNDAASDGQCNHKNQIKLTNSCLTASEHGNTSWYEARTECISEGGDLAVLSYQDFQKHKNHPSIQHHWIGLREVNWIWKVNNNQGSEEIKYTKWSNSRPPSSAEEICIAVNVHDGRWIQRECSYEMPVVCEKRIAALETIVKSTTTRSTRSTTHRPNIAGQTTTAIKSTITESTTARTTAAAEEEWTAKQESCEMNNNSVGLVLGIGVIIPLLVVIAILIVVILNQRRKLRTISVSRTDNTAEAEYQGLKSPDVYANDSDNYAVLTLQS